MAVLDDTGLASKALVAYSLSRHLRSAYTGPTCRLKDSLASEADFYPDGAGGLAQGSAVGDDPETWGTGPFEVVAVYDQSGNGIDQDVRKDGSNWPVLDIISHPLGRAGFHSFGFQSTNTISPASGANSLIMSAVVQSEVTDTNNVNSCHIIGHTATTLAGLTANASSGDNVNPVPIPFQGTADFGETVQPVDTIDPGEAAVVTFVKPTAGNTTSDAEMYIEGVLGGTLASATWDIRSGYSAQLGAVQDPLELMPIFEAVWIQDTSDVNSTDLADLIADQQTYYETRDYSPGSGELTAMPLTAQAATIGTPAVSQNHAIEAAGLSADVATVGTPAVSQVHALAATGLDAEAATVGQPAAGQVHNIAATGLTAEPATLGTPTVSETNGLVAVGIVAEPATIGIPAAGQVHAVQATGPTASAATIGEPAIAQVHALTVAGLVAANATIQAPALVVAGAGDVVRFVIERAPIRATAEIGPTRATIQRAA